MFIGEYRMSANFLKVESLERLDELFNASYGQPVFIFKHSNSCGISSGVYRLVQGISSDINLIIVQEARAVSNAVESRTGIPHESPQAIVLKDGEVIYHGSHYDIEVAEISESLNV